MDSQYNIPYTKNHYQNPSIFMPNSTINKCKRIINPKDINDLWLGVLTFFTFATPSKTIKVHLFIPHMFQNNSLGSYALFQILGPSWIILSNCKMTLKLNTIISCWIHWMTSMRHLYSLKISIIPLQQHLVLIRYTSLIQIQVIYVTWLIFRIGWEKGKGFLKTV